MSAPPLLYADDVETIPPDEAEDIERVLEALRQLLVDHAVKTGRRQRDVHVKSHACVDAVFEVLPGLPEDLAQGLFRLPRSYAARVRLSNSSPYIQPDAVPDGRGLAIQVRDISGEFLPRATAGEPTQDWLMANHPVFVAKDVKDYLRLQRIRLEANRHPWRAARGALTGGRRNPLDWRWREAVSTAQVLAQLPRHPANYTYFSMTPIRYGRHLAKYRVRPDGERASSLAVLTRAPFQADAMRNALTETLRTRDLRFELQVQLQTDPRTMPVEDATIEWPERQSPYRTVARVIVPRQDLSAVQDGHDNHLIFNVWNALVDHRPLGGINRVRREAYRVSAQWRTSR